MKLGRKEINTSFEILFKYLKNESGSMRQIALAKGISPVSQQRRMLKAAQQFNTITPWPDIPSGDLIAIADACIQFLDGVQNTIYFILLRSIHSHQTVIAPFLVCINASEDFLGWQNAFHQIPPEAHQRIKALVCDGRTAFTPLARKNDWVIQRCHFHLLARIAHNRSLSKASRTGEEGKRFQHLARIVITSKNRQDIFEALYELEKLSTTIQSYSFKTVLSGFLKHFEEYRTYLNYPHYNLPTTSNSAEHLIGLVRDLQYRARGFKSLPSLTLWIEALLKFTKKVTANGKISLPN